MPPRALVRGPRFTLVVELQLKVLLPTAAVQGVALNRNIAWYKTRVVAQLQGAVLSQQMKPDFLCSAWYGEPRNFSGLCWANIPDASAPWPGDAGIACIMM